MPLRLIIPDETAGKGSRRLGVSDSSYKTYHGLALVPVLVLI